jgi:hypothetical protein
MKDMTGIPVQSFQSDVYISAESIVSGLADLGGAPIIESTQNDGTTHAQRFAFLCFESIPVERLASSAIAIRSGLLSLPRPQTESLAITRIHLTICPTLQDTRVPCFGMLVLFFAQNADLSRIGHDRPNCAEHSQTGTG